MSERDKNHVWWMGSFSLGMPLLFVSYKAHREFIIDNGRIDNPYIDEQLWAISEDLA